MRFGKIAALAAVAAALGLSACGGSEFKSKMTAMCEKEGGKIPGAGTVDCACAANVMDAELPSDLKDFFIKMADAQEDPAKAADAMKDMDPKDLADKMQKLQEVGDKLNERMAKECKKG